MCPSGTTASASGAARSSDLRRAFDVIDTDGDGLISRDDLRSFFSAAYHNHDEELIGAMIAVADSDGDGLVDFSEFKRMIPRIEGRRKTGEGEISGSSSSAGPGVMEEAFRLMDSDGDGRLSHGDLKRFLVSSGLDASDEDVIGMMRLAAEMILLLAASPLMTSSASWLSMNRRKFTRFDRFSVA